MRYAADRAFRQYDAADPANRLVAAELELRWNRALTRLSEMETRIAAHDRAAPPRSELSAVSFVTLADGLANGLASADDRCAAEETDRPRGDQGSGRRRRCRGRRDHPVPPLDGWDSHRVALAQTSTWAARQHISGYRHRRSTACLYRQ